MSSVVSAKARRALRSLCVGPGHKLLQFSHTLLRPGRVLALRRVVVLVLAGLFWPSPASSAQVACDLNRDGAINVADLQSAINMFVGVSPCTATINGTACDAVVVQRIISGTLGQACVVSSDIVPHSASLIWVPSTSENVTGYNIYRRSPGEEYKKLNSALITMSTYTDGTVQAGQTYYYVATAVDSNNNESAYSNEAQATIPSP